MKQLLKTFSFSALLTILFSISCIESEPITPPDTFDAKKQAQIDDSLIVEYLQKNEIEANKDTSGIYYIITNEGDGNKPNLNSTIKVNYKAYLTNGLVFDETPDQARTFALNTLILGWKIGIPFISRGGEAILFIPSGLAYGNNAIGSIPINSILIFEIELVDFY